MGRAYVLLVYLWFLTPYSILKKHQWAQQWLGYLHQCPFSLWELCWDRFHNPNSKDTLRHAFCTLLIIHSFRCDSYGLIYKTAFQVHKLIYACYQTLRFYREGLGCQTAIKAILQNNFYSTVYNRKHHSTVPRSWFVGIPIYIANHYLVSSPDSPFVFGRGESLGTRLTITTLLSVAPLETIKGK